MESSRRQPTVTLVPSSLLPAWVPWLQLGLSSMLLVLFFVILGQARSNSSQLRELGTRVQGLESSRALERTSALEQQLRTAMQRLQALEKENGRLQAANQERDDLERRLLELRGAASATAAGSGGEGPSIPSRVTPPPSPSGPQMRRQASLSGGLQRLPPPLQRPSAPVLRPPADVEY